MAAALAHGDRLDARPVAEKEHVFRRGAVPRPGHLLNLARTDPERAGERIPSSWLLYVRTRDRASAKAWLDKDGW